MSRLEPGCLQPDAPRPLFLLLGSNQGDRMHWIQSGIKGIEERIGEVEKTSPLYETQPWGNENQPDFLNLALRVSSQLSAREILTQVQAIEKEGGRQRIIKWGPRTLDIDILFIDKEVIQWPELVVPHPAMADRRFVLQPLADIAPDWIHPLSGLTIPEMLHQCTDPLAAQAYAPQIP